MGIKSKLMAASGTYTTANGEEKKRWVEVGLEMENKDGGTFIVLHPHINLAGLIRSDKGGGVMVSKFDPEGKGGGDKGSESQQRKEKAGSYHKPLDDDFVPF